MVYIQSSPHLYIRLINKVRLGPVQTLQPTVTGPATKILEDATEFHKQGCKHFNQYQTLKFFTSSLNFGTHRTAECETAAVAIASDPQSKHRLQQPQKYHQKTLQESRMAPHIICQKINRNAAATSRVHASD